MQRLGWKYEPKNYFDSLAYTRNTITEVYVSASISFFQFRLTWQSNLYLETCGKEKSFKYAQTVSWIWFTPTFPLLQTLKLEWQKGNRQTDHTGLSLLASLSQLICHFLLTSLFSVCFYSHTQTHTNWKTSKLCAVSKTSLFLCNMLPYACSCLVF